MTDELEITNGAGPRAIEPTIPPRGRQAADRIREADFPIVLRGYDRETVDAFLTEVADLVEVLESRQARETVVQRALEEVGEQTSSILKQAHESADDITARSRSQAEDRLERAREDAAAVTAEAEERAQRLERETATLWDERAALIEDIRRIAGDALVIADDANVRLDSPATVEASEAPTEVTPVVDEAPLGEPLEPEVPDETP